MSKTSDMSKTGTGNFFEDFRVGQEIRHATPRTLTEADAALNIALYGSRFAINSSDVFARALGLPRAPLDDLLVFHVVIGKTVPDISLNAVANLGYAEFRWGVPVYPGDTRVGAVDGSGPAREFQPCQRRRLGALDRNQSARRDGARLCALGDGAQARSAGSGRRAGGAEDRGCGGAGRSDRAGRPHARWPTTMSRRARRIAGRTTRRASASIM